MNRLRRLFDRAIGVMIALCVGCASTYPNPSFPIDSKEARTRLDELKKSKKQLERPLLVLGGFLDPGIGPATYRKVLGQYVEGDIITMSFANQSSFEACRERVISGVDQKFPTVDPDQTIEVDVLGESMGGLVAMFSALDDPELGRRLRIRNLYTISSPLRGAKLAQRSPFLFNSMQKNMKPGSPLYQKIESSRIDYQIFSYTRLNDDIVGEEFASAADHGVWWVDNPHGEPAHVGAMLDRRILLDVILRLRNEKPVTKWPPADLPKQK